PASPAVHATLTFTPRHPMVLARAAVERAAALVPTLMALQEALAPSGAERQPGPALGDALDAATEIFGAGALDAGSLILGDYGTSPGAAEDEAPASMAPAAEAGALVRLLVDRMLRAARAGQNEIHLDADQLAPLLGPAPQPPTFELCL